jgi:flagellar biosynthetic protein FliO
MGFLDYLQAIIVIGAVIFAAYYVTKLIAKTGGGTFRKSSNIKLIASLPLSKDKSVALVEIGDHAYVLGVGAHHVELLDKLALSELQLTQEEPAPTPKDFAVSFKEELSARLKKLKK